MRAFLYLTVLFLFLGSGWILGARYGAPPMVMDAVDRLAGDTAGAAREAAEGVSGDLQGVAEGVRGDVRGAAGEVAGDVQGAVDDLFAYFEQDDAALAQAEAEQAAAVNGAGGEAAAPAAPARLQSAAGADAYLLCDMRVSNPPPADENRVITTYSKLIDVNGVEMLLAPATDACLASGFGPRGSSGKLHKGVDFYSKTGGQVLAAADGVIVEAVYRDDYGYMIIIDHGNGVYTRYAHLQRFARGVEAGRTVKRGDKLGPIGRSGAYTSIVHLHWEILLGDYDTPKKSFGLTAKDPYSFPAA